MPRAKFRYRFSVKCLPYCNSLSGYNSTQNRNERGQDYNVGHVSPNTSCHQIQNSICVGRASISQPVRIIKIVLGVLETREWDYGVAQRGQKYTIYLCIACVS